MASENKLIYTDICEEIKATVSLQDEMEKHGVTLLRSGRRLRCVCPFHDDSDPSMYINIEDDPEWFFCFGCDKNGTVIDFIQYFQGTNLTDTIKYFCDNYAFKNSVNVVSIEDLLAKDLKKKKIRHLVIPFAMKSSILVNSFLKESSDKKRDLKSIKPLLKEIDRAVEMEDRVYLKSACRVLDNVIEAKKKKRN